jgi:hypothetical protein
MIRSVLMAMVLLATPPAFAMDFEANDYGQIEFMMPSGNIGCIYTPKGGTELYEPVGGGPELSCDRVEPAYVRVILGPKDKALRPNDVGDASCCSATNSFGYSETWSFDGFICKSSTAALTCRRGKHGFSISRKAIKAW